MEQGEEKETEEDESGEVPEPKNLEPKDEVSVRSFLLWQYNLIIMAGWVAKSKEQRCEMLKGKRDLKTAFCNHPLVVFIFCVACLSRKDT